MGSKIKPTEASYPSQRMMTILRAFQIIYLASLAQGQGESVGNKNGQEDQAGCQQCIEVTDGPLKGSYTYDLNLASADCFCVYKGPNDKNYCFKENGLYNVEFKCVVCNTTKADIVFILDTSGSVAQDFMQELNFTSSLVKEFPVSPTETQFGVITFASDAVTEFELNRFAVKIDVQNAINQITFRGGGTDIGRALDLARTQSFPLARGGAIPKIAILITDGVSVAGAVTAADRLKGTGVKIYSIGVGNNVNIQELNGIASDPDTDYVYRVDNFDSITAIKGALVKEVCEGAKQRYEENLRNGATPAQTP